MKLIQFFFKAGFVVLLFILGVSAADKEYLSDRIIGIQITGAAHDMDSAVLDELRNYLSSIEADSPQELYALIEDSDMFTQNTNVFYEPRYFESTIQNDFHIPSGMYNTVCVQLNYGQEPLTSILKLTAPVSTRFQSTDEPVFTQVQKGYLAFLSFIGNVEKIVNNFKDGL